MTTTSTRTVVEPYKYAAPADPFPSLTLPEHRVTLPSVLEAHNVNAWFGNRQVLGDINIAFPQHSVTALIGPSGCGKSSLLRVFNRLHELIPKAALSGRVMLEDADIYDAAVDPVEIRSRVGMIFQKPNPFPSMTVRGNVLSGFKLSGKGIAKQDEEETVELALTSAGLWNEVKDRLNDSADSLSGGQQQRLVIARAIAVEPEVLLMDEPCSALDPGSTLRIEETIRLLSERMTIVIVTHNMHQARRVADYTAFLHADTNKPGTIVEQGPTDYMFYDSHNQLTVDYVNGKFG